MKNIIKFFLQKLLGFPNYLYFFAWYKVKTLRSDRRENDFFAFLDLLPPDGIVLDIGANIGIMTVHLAKHVTNGKVIAFEPIPDNVKTLERIIRKFSIKNVAVEVCALGDRAGRIEMVMPVESGAKQQGLSHVVHDSITERNEGLRFPVSLKVLDEFEFAKQETPRITGIKMDVENFECFVLAGARELLARHQPVLYLELWPNENRHICFEIVKKLDYTIYVNTNGRLEIFDPAKHKKQNFIMRFAKSS
ncbi:MAG TPA: FkbM family methyltransferase [Bacteroidia bacterium]|nr:FkbM family methyltransferase [Bacteroidia bacterium]